MNFIDFYLSKFTIYNITMGVVKLMKIIIKRKGTRKMIDFFRIIIKRKGILKVIIGVSL